MPIQLDHKDLWFKLKMEAFHASILDMEVGGEKSQVLLRDYQMHPFRPLILHADFQRVDGEQEDPHEGAAALRERRDLARREGRRRPRRST